MLMINMVSNVCFTFKYSHQPRSPSWGPQLPPPQRKPWMRSKISWRIKSSNSSNLSINRHHPDYLLGQSLWSNLSNNTDKISSLKWESSINNKVNNSKVISNRSSKQSRCCRNISNNIRRCTTLLDHHLVWVIPAWSRIGRGNKLPPFQATPTRTSHSLYR